MWTGCSGKWGRSVRNDSTNLLEWSNTLKAAQTLRVLRPEGSIGYTKYKPANRVLDRTPSKTRFLYTHGIIDVEGFQSNGPTWVEAPASTERLATMVTSHRRCPAKPRSPHRLRLLVSTSKVLISTVYYVHRRPRHPASARTPGLIRSVDAVHQRGPRGYGRDHDAEARLTLQDRLKEREQERKRVVERRSSSSTTLTTSEPKSRAIRPS